MTQHVDTIIDGLPYVVMVPDGAPADRWSAGVIVGPPDLAPLGLPAELENRLHKELYARNIITPVDAQRKRSEITAAIMAAMTLDAERVYGCYLGILAPTPPPVVAGLSGTVVEKGVVFDG